jgi:D-3-phosphoglycerate dehydrogenase
VSATPGVFSDAVADVVTAYIILLARRLHELDRGVRAGGWPKVQGQSLVDKRLGVIGVGSIGRGVIRRARALGMTVCGYDVAGVPEAYCRETDLEPLELNALLEKSDFVSLNCPLTPQTRHMLGEAEFARMKGGAFVINTGRGPLIDEAALVLALRQGKIAGAALDVFEEEPLPPDSPLREFDNCIFGTHNASNTLEAVLRVNTLAIDNLLRGLGLAE